MTVAGDWTGATHQAHPGNSVSTITVIDIIIIIHSQMFNCIKSLYIDSHGGVVPSFDFKSDFVVFQ